MRKSVPVLPEGKTYHVFVSHSKRLSEDFALMITTSFISRGFTVFFDLKDLLRVSRLQLEKEVQSSCVVVMVLDNDFLTKPAPTFEIKTAAFHELPIIPVLDIRKTDFESLVHAGCPLSLKWTFDANWLENASAREDMSYNRTLVRSKIPETFGSNIAALGDPTKQKAMLHAICGKLDQAIVCVEELNALCGDFGHSTLSAKIVFRGVQESSHEAMLSDVTVELEASSDPVDIAEGQSIEIKTPNADEVFTATITGSKNPTMKVVTFDESNCATDRFLVGHVISLHIPPTN